MQRRPNALVAAAVLIAIGGLASTPEARLNLAFARADDPSPRRVEIAANVAGLAVAFLFTWSETRQPLTN